MVTTINGHTVDSYFYIPVVEAVIMEAVEYELMLIEVADIFEGVNDDA